MKAITLKKFGGVENFAVVDIPVPAIQDDEVLVEVKSISINPVDAKTRAGKAFATSIQDQMPAIIGWDISGVVTKAGAGVKELKIGDSVFGMVAFPKLANAYAAFVAAKANELAIKPANINHNEAAAATLAALTAWQVLTSYTAIKPGDKVLVHAAAGGVGHYAVQLAKHLGAYVIGTSSAANKDLVLLLGADEHLDYKTQDFEKELKDLDFVLDCFAGETLEKSLNVVKKGGTVITILHGFNEALSAKAKALGVNGHNLLVKPSGEDMKTLAGFLGKGIIKSHVSKVFPFEQMGDAHLQVETGRTVGKIIVSL